MANKYCSCKKTQTAKKKQPMSIILGIVIAVLPKCPFCAFGYSCTIAMCSGLKITQYTPNAYAIIPVLIALIVTLSFFANYKGKKTQISIAIGTIGTILISTSQFITGSPTQYFTATAIIFFAVFYNGSFSHFARQFKKILQTKSKTNYPLKTSKP